MGLADRIKRHEGCRLTPYYDTLGVLSIGYGRNLKFGISQDEADIMFEHDLQKAAAAAMLIPGYQYCDRVRRGVLCEMVFQLGLRGVLRFRRMIEAIGNKQFVLAAGEMIDSRWHRQTPKRVEELAELMANGEDGEVTQTKGGR